jgi:hypothetical protein
MKFSSTLTLGIVTILLAALNAGCSRTTAPKPALRYDGTHRCGGIARHWYTAQNIPAGGVLGNELQISGSGSLLWNGAPASSAMMNHYAAQLTKMEPPPQLWLVVSDGVPCTVTTAVRQLFARYCVNSRCTEFSADEWEKYSKQIAVYSPSQK